MSTVSASFVTGNGQRKRPRIDLATEEDADDGRVPSLVLPVLPRFPGLDRAVIIAIFEHTFRPKKDPIKLRSPEFKASALDGESFGLKSKTQMLLVAVSAPMEDRFCCNIFTAFHTYLSISRTIRP